jgi:hypothetical protein
MKNIATALIAAKRNFKPIAKSDEDDEAELSRRGSLAMTHTQAMKCKLLDPHGLIIELPNLTPSKPN